MAAPASANPPAAHHDRFLGTDHLHDDLRGRSVRGGAVTLTAQFVKHLLGLVGLAVLARLLTPGDFGLLAMVAGFTNFLVQFKELGLAMATVQRKDITHQQVSTLFWVNVGVGLVATLLTVALAPLLAWFYREPSLTLITLALAVAFAFGGLTVQHQALLRRQMRFTALGALQVASAAAGLIAGMVAAWLGAGYWALVIMQLTVAATNAIGVWVACGWRPGRPVRGAGVSSMLAFGGNLTAAGLLNYVTRNLDKVLIGWRWGDVAVGLYANAYRLLLLPLQQFNAPLSTVAIPGLSRLQDKPAQYREYYRKGLQLLALVGMPVVVFTFVVADHVVAVMFGPGWEGAVPIFRLLGPAAFFGTFNVATGWVYISLGQAKRQLQWNVMATPIIVLSFVVGLPWGPVGVAAAYSAAACATRIPAILFCYKTAPVRSGDLLSALWRPAAASLLSGVVLFVVQRFVLAWPSAFLCLLVGLLTYAACYILVWSLVPNGRGQLRELVHMVGDLRPPSSADKERTD